MTDFVALICGAWLYKKYGWTPVWMTAAAMFFIEIVSRLYAEELENLAYVAGVSTRSILGF